MTLTIPPVGAKGAIGVEEWKWRADAGRMFAKTSAGTSEIESRASRLLFGHGLVGDFIDTVPLSSPSYTP